MKLSAAWILSLLALIGILAVGTGAGFDVELWSVGAFAIGYAGLMVLLASRIWLLMCNPDVLMHDHYRAAAGLKSNGAVALVVAVQLGLYVVIPVLLLAADGPWLEASVLVMAAMAPASLGLCLTMIVLKYHVTMSRYLGSLHDARRVLDLSDDPDTSVDMYRATVNTVGSFHRSMQRSAPVPLSLQDALHLVYSTAFVAYSFILTVFLIGTYILETNYGWQLTQGTADWGRFEYVLFGLAWIADLASLGLFSHFDVSISSLSHDPTNIGFSMLFYGLKALGVLLLVAYFGSAASDARFVEDLAEELPPDPDEAPTSP